MKTPTIVAAVLCGCINAASARDVAVSNHVGALGDHLDGSSETYGPPEMIGSGFGLSQPPIARK
jgi:hypothetical protein